MKSTEFIDVSLQLDEAGLVWHPEIGDEVADRHSLERISILVDPHGLTPTELRSTFLWLPSVEQLVHQFEARQALIYHAGITEEMLYQAVVRSHGRMIEAAASSLRVALGKALQQLLQKISGNFMH
jgi:hypothetical protein